MNKMSKVVLASLVLIALVLAPACRTGRKKVEPPKTETQAPAPVIAPPPETKVEEPTDFVEEAKPVEETFPSEVEELNRYVQERGYIRDAYYSYDESTLDADAQAALTASANWLKSDRGRAYNLLVEGHCDERGTEQYNLALGDRRANTAKDFLVTLGVDASRIRTVSYGEERPFSEGHDEGAWRQNRRAHLVLVR